MKSIFKKLARLMSYYIGIAFGIFVVVSLGLIEPKVENIALVISTASIMIFAFEKDEKDG